MTKKKLTAEQELVEGARIGFLTLLRPAPRRGINKYWVCKCDCGAEREIARSALRPSRARDPQQRCSAGCSLRSAYHASNFWENVEEQPDGCWRWLGSKCGGGYAQVNYSGRKYLVHRRSYELTHGSVPEGKNVLHSCDNPECVNPEHLFVGTQADNVRDMMIKGRAGWMR